MSTRHALLGLLLHKPAHRYQLGERLQERLGPAWAINSGHLYQTADRLEKEGLIQRIGPDARNPDKRTIFAATESGAEEYESWFEKDAGGAQPLRRPLLVKIALAGPDRLEDVLEQIDAYERDCASLLQEASRERDRLPTDKSRVRADHVLLKLGLAADIAHFKAELGWAKHAHEIVSWLLSQDDAIWPIAHDRPGTSAEQASDRQIARDDLFARIAARQQP